jgi:hypothetical protein
MPPRFTFDRREVEPWGEACRRLVGGRESSYPAPMVENGWKLYLDLAARLVALVGFLALVWLVGLLWPPGAPPPAAIPVAAPLAAPTIPLAAPTIVEPAAPATAPVQVAETPGPVPEAAPPSESFAPPSEPAPPPPALVVAPKPPPIVVPRELRPESMSDAHLLNLLELRRIERTARRQR